MTKNTLKCHFEITFFGKKCHFQITFRIFAYVIHPYGKMIMREELLQDYLLWNAQAFKMLYNNYYKALSNYAFQILKNDAAAEDIVQGLFSYLYESKPQFTSIHSMEAYLYNAIKHNCIDSLRRDDVKRKYERDLSISASDTPISDGEFITEQVYKKLFATIDRLPARSKEVFLQYMDGKSNKIIAEALGISLETVKIHKKRSMAFLRKELDEKDYVIILVLVLHLQNLAKC